MAGTGRDGQSRRGPLPYRRALVATLVLALAMVAAPAAFADRKGSPATGQYTLQVPNAGGSGGSGGPPASGASTKVGGSDSSSALPVIGLGALVVGSAGIALLYVRRRRSHEAA